MMSQKEFFSDIVEFYRHVRLSYLVLVPAVKNQS